MFVRQGLFQIVHCFLVVVNGDVLLGFCLSQYTYFRLISNALNMNVSGARPNALAHSASLRFIMFVQKYTDSCYIVSCTDSTLIPDLTVQAIVHELS